MKNFFKNIIATAFFFSLSLMAVAQQTAETAAAPAAGDDFLMKVLIGTVFIGGVIVIVAAVLTLLRISELLSKNIVQQYMTEQGKAAATQGTAAAPAPRPSFWQRFNQQMTQVVPIEKEKDIIFDHAFDGIRELDNKLPPWWVWMFYITIAIGVVYFAYYHVLGIGEPSTVRYEKAMAQAEEVKQARLKVLAANVDENSVTPATDANDLAAGKATFTASCVACHGGAGEGGVGPNLTDDYWIHGGGVKNIFKTVKYGVPAKGMIAWESQLSPIQIKNVASYILTLRGTNPPNGKEPQGELYVESDAPPTDSTATPPADSSGVSASE